MGGWLSRVASGVTRLRSLVAALAVSTVAAGGLAAVTTAAMASERLPVVATFSILGDLVETVGGERVSVTTLVGRDSDTHVFQPTPSDVAAVARARVVVENGLGFEGWLGRMFDVAGFSGVRIVASKDLRAPLIADEAGGHHGHAHHGHRHGSDRGSDRGAEAGQVDPHAWQDPRNVFGYVAAIRDGLCLADPDGCATYTGNARSYEEALRALDEEIRSRIGRIAEARRKVITSHDAFGYFARAYGLTMLAPEGLSTEREASAKEVARLIRQIKSQGIRAVFVETVANPRLISQIARETGLQVSGRLYSDALSAEGGPAGTYLDMIRHNAVAIAEALEASP